MNDETNRTAGATLRTVLDRLAQGAGTLDDAAAGDIDRRVRSAIARVTRGMSPVAIVLAYTDWLAHMAISPGKALQLVQSLVRKGIGLGVYGAATLRGEDALPPAGGAARRLRGEAWQRWPFNVVAQAHTLARQWTREVTTGVSGVTPANERLVAFLSDQVVTLLSPANLPVTNPEVLETTVRERGANLVRGMQNLREDLARRGAGTLPAGTDAYRVGADVAATPGKVVFRNRLVELIQYVPVTGTVGVEPVFIVPAWIMKYYILDLLPEHSLVKYLVEQGKTVFIVSWKNPDETDHDLGMEDYLRLGVMEPLDAVQTITGCDRVQAVGYCLGGTLLTIAAALMARDGDERLRSMTTFASQIDFTEAGEVLTYLDESTYAFLDAMMAGRGYLEAENMINAFKALRAESQIHSPLVERYLLGGEAGMSDLMAWNVDGTRLPHRMHAEYLRHCYLDNGLAEGRYPVGGRPVCVGDIRVPAFILGTVTDHVAPWQSVYKANRLMDNDEVTFVLTTAGHNAGIVSGPQHPRRKYQVRVHRPGDKYIDPQTWIETTQVHDGSWWPLWNEWLDAQMSGTREPPPMGAPAKGYDVVGDAPGEYVFG